LGLGRWAGRSASPNTRIWSRASLGKLARRWQVALLAAVTVAAGCGSAGGVRQSTPTYTGLEPKALTKGGYVPSGANGWHRIASERVPGGRVSVFGRYYPDPVRRSFELQVLEEEKGPAGHYRPGGGGSGPALRPGEILAMHLSRGCIGNHEVVFTYGQLARPHDAVIAKGPGGSTRLRKAAIPARLHAEGVLVYGLLGRAGATLIARTPNGARDAEVDLTGNERLRCGRRPVG
jgi:hypothetical protein